MTRGSDGTAYRTARRRVRSVRVCRTNRCPWIGRLVTDHPGRERGSHRAAATAYRGLFEGMLTSRGRSSVRSTVDETVEPIPLERLTWMC
jgi:hypothetical protein